MLKRRVKSKCCLIKEVNASFWLLFRYLTFNGIVWSPHAYIKPLLSLKKNEMINPQIMHCWVRATSMVQKLKSYLVYVFFLSERKQRLDLPNDERFEAFYSFVSWYHINLRSLLGDWSKKTILHWIHVISTTTPAR